MEPDGPKHINPDDRQRLGSWKEIANYLGRTVRTVQRWEKTSNLPVRRLQHDVGSTVFAYKSELDQWITRQSLVMHKRDDRKPEPAPHAKVQEAPDPPVESAKTINVSRRVVIAVLSARALIILVENVLTMRRIDNNPTTTNISTSRLLTVDPGIERFPALSPTDGRSPMYEMVLTDKWTST